MYHPTDRIAHSTAYVKPVVEHLLEREFFLQNDHVDKLNLNKENNDYDL